MNSNSLDTTPTLIDISEASISLSKLIEIALDGREVLITKDGLPMVKLVSVSPKKPRRQAGSAKELISISDDFNEPLEDFKDYM